MFYSRPEGDTHPHIVLKMCQQAKVVPPSSAVGDHARLAVEGVGIRVEARTTTAGGGLTGGIADRREVDRLGQLGIELLVVDAGTDGHDIVQLICAGKIEVHGLDFRAQGIISARPGAVVLGRQPERCIDAGANGEIAGDRTRVVEIGHERRLARVTPTPTNVGPSQDYSGTGAVYVGLEAWIDVMTGDNDLLPLKARHASGVVPHATRVFRDGDAPRERVTQARCVVFQELEERGRGRHGGAGKCQGQGGLM